MRRIFVSASAVGEKSIRIEGPDAHHISRVLRMRPGDILSVCADDGTEYTCVIQSIGECVEAGIRDLQRAADELPVRIVLFQCLPKKDKMELIIQKAVELGVSCIVPVISERTISRPDEKRSAERVKRWNTIARNAAEQSKRSCIPTVSSLVSFEEALQMAAQNDLNIMPYENAGDMSNTRRVMHSLAQMHRVGVMIGPEGGFSEKEAERCREAGFEIITLGRRILRTETAGITTLSVMMYELES